MIIAVIPAGGNLVCVCTQVAAVIDQVSSNTNLNI